MRAKNFIDRTGRKYGLLTIISLNQGGKDLKWNCKCDCGNSELFVARSRHLVSGATKSCGCLLHKDSKLFIDMTGEKYGRLTVSSINFKAKTKGNITKWNCICDCGKERIVSSTNLRSGHSLSCGCLKKEITSRVKTTHGMTRDNPRLYNIWQGMMARCHRITDDAYRWYGAKGVVVCEEWRNDNSAFFKWALSNGYKSNLTVDRMDSKGNYCPENCQWITQKEQTLRRECVMGVETAAHIKYELSKGAKSPALALKYGYHNDTIGDLKRGKTWKDVLPQENK